MAIPKKMRRRWTPSDRFRAIRVIDAHTAGEPLRLIVDGLPEPKGATILEKRRDFRGSLDHLRTALMWEPRGHADMYGCVLTEPETDDGDFGVLFLHNEGYSTMCGHGVIAVATIVLECGLVQADAGDVVLRLDTPAGRVTATAEFDGTRVQQVAFANVPSFVDELDCRVEFGADRAFDFDLAFGGAYYAIGAAEPLGLKLEPANVSQLVVAANDIKSAIEKSRQIEHPTHPDLGFLYGVIFTGEAERSGRHSRNVCVFAAGEVDRSPTGTGISARAAVLHQRGELALGETIEIESILGSTMSVRVAEAIDWKGRPAVVPTVSGSAYLSGQAEFLIDPDDPLRDGFLLK